MTLLLRGDAREVLRAFPDGSVNACITSPPYWMLRDYGIAGQIGRENAVEEYLQRLLDIFEEVKRVLTPDGTCWVNLGDKYRDTCAQLIPERFAIGMVERGWILRSKIIWHKKNSKPESIKSRFTLDWEPVYFFAKSKQHFFKQQFEPYCPETLARAERFVRNKEAFDPSKHKQDANDPLQAPMLLMGRIVKSMRLVGGIPETMHKNRSKGMGQDMYYDSGRNMRSVWMVGTAQYEQAHFAVWPMPLVRRMILAGCPTGGIVLDPFVGSGTTLVVAEEQDCGGIGIDLNSDYLSLATARILEARKMWAKIGKASQENLRISEIPPHIHVDFSQEEYVEL